MNFAKRITDYKKAEDIRKNAKSVSWSELFDHPFSLIFSSFIVLVFLSGVFSAFSILRVLLAYKGIKYSYLIFVFAYLLSFPCLKGFFVFINHLILTKRKKFTIIFYYYTTIYRFKTALKQSLFTLFFLLLLIIPFIFIVELPYLLHLPDEAVLIFELGSVIILVYSALIFLSYIFYKKPSPDNISFFGSFWVHYIILFLTKGLYFLIFLPFFALSILNYKTLNKEVKQL
ncbi:hypothetical protein LJB90_03720 [Eubacteriales bacterium OttesenSCG-928-G02]|nr:hypothetical protein [Eubacteriales bacterium OttesenSCG-928-G02]